MGQIPNEPPTLNDLMPVPGLFRIPSMRMRVVADYLVALSSLRPDSCPPNPSQVPGSCRYLPWVSRTLSCSEHLPKFESGYPFG